MQVGAVGILLEHIQEVAWLRIFVVALVHLSITHSGVYRQRFGGLFGYQVDDSSSRTASVEGGACTFHYLDAIDGMKVEAFIVQVARHVARHALAVHQEQHVPGIQSLHGDFVAEAHFLYVQSRSFLLESLLQIGVSGIHQLLAAQYLRCYGGQFDGACRTRTRHDYFVQAQCVFFQVNGFGRFGGFYPSRIGHEADVGHFVIPRVTGRKFQYGLPIRVGDGVLRVLHGLVVSIGNVGGDDGLFRPVL